MQALVSEDLRGSLFGFEGADKAPTLWRERKREANIKVRLGRKLSLHTFFLEAVKTAASHAANMGSIPVRVTTQK